MKTSDPCWRRERYRWFCELATRWQDNDNYGHVNNVTYYSYFDTCANRYLIEHCGLDIELGAVIGLVVASGCDYRRPVAFPDMLELGLCVEHLGKSSVRYGLAVFRRGEPEAAASGHFVHVFVDRQQRTSVPMPTSMREGLARLLVPSSP